MTYKLAILSDIHGNLTALEVVLAQLEKEQITDYLILGDLVMPGPGTSDMLQRLRTLPNATFVRGNWDDRLLNASHLNLTTPEDTYFARLAQYNYEHLSKEELEFIKNLPLYEITTFHQWKLILTHHLPQKNWGSDLISPEQLFIKSDLNIALHGHSHTQVAIQLEKNKWLINPGSIGQYPAEKGVAAYAIIELEPNHISCRLETIPYDLELELKRAKESQVPYVEVYEEILTSGRTPKMIDLQKKWEPTYRNETIHYFKMRREKNDTKKLF